MPRHNGTCDQAALTKPVGLAELDRILRKIVTAEFSALLAPADLSPLVLVALAVA
jgi:hypothetical protein